MKYLLLSIFCLISVIGFTQSTLPLRADTVLVEKSGGNAELKVKNSTRDTLGIMVNFGGGRTKFMKVRQINDTTFVIPPYGSGDTIRIKGSGGGSSTDTTNLSNRINEKASQEALDDTAAVLRAAIGTGGTPPGVDEQVIINDAGAFGADAGLTYNKTTRKLISDTVSQVKGVADAFKLNRTLFFSPPDSLSAYGHSYVVGLNASVFDSSFIGRLTTYYDLPLTNHGASGRGIWQAAQYHHQYISPNHRAMTVIMPALNDVRRGGLGYKTIRKVTGGYNSIIANHFLSAWSPAGSSVGNITRYGTWLPGYLSSSVGGKSVTNGAFTNILNDSIVYEAQDSTFVIGLIGGDSSGLNYNFSVFEIHVDGVLYGTFSEGNMTDGISDGSNDNKRSPFALIIRGLTNSTHRVKLINKTSGAYFIVDYFGHLIDASQALPMMIFHDPKLDATGYAISPALATDGVINSINASVDSLVESTWYGYPIYIAETENHFINTTASGLDGDHIHQNNLGGLQIAQAGIDALPEISVEADNGSFLLGGRPYIKLADRLREIALYDEVMPRSDSSNYIQNSPVSQQSASFSISGNGRIGASLYTGSNITTTASAPAFRAYTGGTSMMQLYKFSNENYLFSSDSTSTTGVSLNMPVGNFLKVGTLSGGTFTPFVEMNNSAINKLAVTGNASFTNTRIGTVSLTDAAATLGQSFSLPSLGLYKSNAGTDYKVTQVRTDDTSYNVVLINDALNASNYGLRIIRTGTTPKNTQLFGEVMIGSQTDQGAYSLQNTGGLYQNGAFSLRSVPLGNNTMKILVRDNSVDSLVRFLDPAAFVANPMTTAGDIIGSTTSGAPIRLAKGTANQILGMSNGATVQEYKTLTGSSSVDISHSAGAVTFSIPSTYVNPAVRDSTGYYTVTVSTTNATPTTIASVTVPDGYVLSIEATCIAQTSDGNHAYTAIKSRGFSKNAISELINGTIATISPDNYLSSGGGLTSATFTITNSGATGAIIQVTGEAATTINWKVRYKLLSLNVSF